MPGAAPERRSPLPGTTRDRILETAAKLFAENGYSATSVRMIAKALGLSDPAVHYHFPTKQSLYDALLTQPDYGDLPLRRRQPTRENVIDEAAKMFAWWTARPEFGQMLLREQLSSDASSLSFMSSSDDAWAERITAPLRLLLGHEEGDDVSAMLFDMLAGVFWDAILSYPDHLAETVTAPYFVARVRGLIARAIPEPEANTHG